jgi:hypothetical protein
MLYENRFVTFSSCDPIPLPGVYCERDIYPSNRYNQTNLHRHYDKLQILKNIKILLEFSRTCYSFDQLI